MPKFLVSLGANTLFGLKQIPSVSETLGITFFTLGVALLGTALMLPLGLALAWLLARSEWPGKALVETLVALPLVLPPVATGLLLLKVIGRHGPVGSFSHDALGLDLVFTWRALVLAAGVMALPLFVRAARVAFEEVPRHLEEAARGLGAQPWRVFTAITVPLAGRGLASGLILAFARALGEFGASVLVAGYIPGRTVTLALGIYHEVQLGRDDRALALVAISATLAFFALWIAEHWLRRPDPNRS